MLYDSQGRYAAAEPLYKRSLKIRETALGPDHPDVGQSLNNLALLYDSQGRYAAAEPLYKRSLKIRETALGPDHPDVGQSLNNLALLYDSQGRYAAAEPLYKRSLKIRETALGPDHPDVGTSLNNLAELYRVQGRYAEAEPLYQRSLKIRETALGPDHPHVATSLNNLALLYKSQGRYAEAEPLYKRDLKITETALGPDHPDVAISLNNLALLYQAQGRYAAAEPLYKRSLKIREIALGPDHPDVGQSLNNLAFLAFAHKDWRTAAKHWRGATDVLIRRTRRGGIIGQKLTGKKKSIVAQNDWYFRGFVKSVYRDDAATKDRGERGKAMFPTAQWALGSDAAGALAKMSARAAANDTALGTLIRERQDLVNEWQKRDQARSQFASLDPNKRDKKRETENAARLDKIDRRISAIDKQLEKDFPDYAAIANPEPLTIKQTQALLDPKEALVLFLDAETWKPTPEESFIWVVTKDDMKWYRSSLGTEGLTTAVEALRCGLDGVSWNVKAEAADCQKLLMTNYDRADFRRGRPLPFNTALAHKLYKELLGPAEDLIKGKKLFLVPSGPLTSLPFQVLITKEPDKSMALKDVAWLIKDYDLSVLPSVASLKALRRNARASAATNTFFGFGNPLLVGNKGTDQRAFKVKPCDFKTPISIIEQKVASLGLRGGINDYYRGGQADVKKLRQMNPLPETADELCAVAQVLKGKPEAVRLGKDATETMVKQLSKDGQLKNAKIIHFATHGLLSGETEELLKARAEPALVLTPPDEGKATDLDDGLLTASEITQLKLDADWVILSACNTAGGDNPGAEPMSGLAKAFFYAGARALLVSHWSVNSDATVALITKSFKAQQKNPKIGRAGALRTAMLELIHSKRFTHPEYWAPFVVVGEGH